MKCYANLSPKIIKISKIEIARQKSKEVISILFQRLIDSTDSRLNTNGLEQGLNLKAS